MVINHDSYIELPDVVPILIKDRKSRRLKKVPTSRMTGLSGLQAEQNWEQQSWNACIGLYYNFLRA